MRERKCIFDAKLIKGGGGWFGARRHYVADRVDRPAASHDQSHVAESFQLVISSSGTVSGIGERWLLAVYECACSYRYAAR